MGGGTIERLVGLFRGRQAADAYVCQSCGTGFDLQYHVCPACGSFSVDAASTGAEALGDD